MAEGIRIRPAREFAADVLSGVMDRAFSDYIAGHEELCPEAVGRAFFERRGFERDTLNQVEMLRPLGGAQP